MPKIYQHSIVVPEQAIDQNGHVNNVEYVRWMQQAAEFHSHREGCTQTTSNLDATWVCSRHEIKYFQPALLHEEIAVLTWVSNMRRASSLRKYKFLRLRDRSILATGETNWIFLDRQTGRPRAIPESVSGLFTLLPQSEESQELDIFIQKHAHEWGLKSPMELQS